MGEVSWGHRQAQRAVHGKCRCGFEFKQYREHQQHAMESGFKWGIIVEHTDRNWRGEPKVSLHLYDDLGRLLMGPNNIPM